MGNERERYEAIVVDPDIDGRTRLRQATLAIPLFGKVQQSAEPREGLQRLRELDRFDVIFLSYRLGEEAITSFIKQARETSSSRDSAFVMVLGRSDQGGSKIATSMINGVNGFLFEPFSVDSLLDITRLAAKVRSERELARQHAAITLLTKQIAPQLDAVSQLRASGHNASVSSRSLREMCSVIASFDDLTRTFYYEALCNAWSSLPPPVDSPKPRVYSGASKRVRVRSEQKIVEQVAQNSDSAKLKASS